MMNGNKTISNSSKEVFTYTSSMATGMTGNNHGVKWCIHATSYPINGNKPATFIAKSSSETSNNSVIKNLYNVINVGQNSFN